MRPGVDEFKTMGLAPYAMEYYWSKAYDALRVYLKVTGMEIDYTSPDQTVYFGLCDIFKTVLW